MGYPVLLVPNNVTKEKRRACVGLSSVEEKIRADASLPSAEKRMGQEKRAESAKKTREWMPRTRGGVDGHIGPLLKRHFFLGHVSYAEKTIIVRRREKLCLVSGGWTHGKNKIKC
jgi:hypothetical protein